MTVASTLNKNIYIGNGATKVWPYTFTINDKSEIHVYLTNPNGFTTEITKDFVVDVLNSQVLYPGYKTGAIPPIEQQAPILPSGWIITIYRGVSLTQDVDLTNQGSFFPEVIEKEFDKLTMMSQQLQEQLNRTLTADISSTANYTLPSPLANAILGWKTDESGIENKSSVPTLFSVPELQSAIDHTELINNPHATTAEQVGAVPTGDVSASAEADMVVRRNSSGQVVGDITGNAATATLATTADGYLPLAGGAMTGAMTVLAAAASGNPVRLGQLLGSIAASGYIKIPVLDGSTVKTVIIQWTYGTAVAAPRQQQTIYFPLTFPTACLWAGVITKADYRAERYFQTISWTATSCVVNSQYSGGNEYSITPYVFAIGY